VSIGGPIGSNMLFRQRLGLAGSDLPAVRLVTPRAEASDFGSVFQLKAFPDHARIFSADSPDQAFIVKSGRVRIVRRAPSGAHSLVSILRPGELFGDPLGPETSNREQVTVAFGETEVWMLNGDVRAQIRSRPALAERLLECYSDRTRKLRQQLSGLATKDVAARLAEAVLTVAEADGERCSHGYEVDVQGITQLDFADLVSSSRSVVSTLLARMRRNGVLGQVGRVLCLRDRPALRRIAGLE